MTQILLSNCPCGSQKKFTECCEPLISGAQKATSPEALMRSRYTAFTLKDVDYLFSTMTPELQQNTDREDMQDFAEEVDSWVKLEVIDTTQDNVEFAAYFMYEGEQQRIHENSQFVQKDGQWFYAGHQHQCSSHSHDHDDYENENENEHEHEHEHEHIHDENCGHNHHHHPQQPYVADVKIGRNDLCPCGSGKKFKKCCIE